MPRDSTKLHAFQTADRLVIDMYTATRALPRHEPYEIGRQLRRPPCRCRPTLWRAASEKARESTVDSSKSHSVPRSRSDTC
jgi:hypothetical protein